MTPDPERALRTGDPADVPRIAARLTPEQAVEGLERLGSRRRREVLRAFPEHLRTTVFERLDPPLQRDLVEQLDPSEAADLFAGLDADDRARMVAKLPAPTAESLLNSLPPADRDSTTALLAYPDGSVGHWMHSQFWSVEAETTVGRALDLLRRDADCDIADHTVVVLDADGQLVGLTGLGPLITADPATRMGTLAQPVPSVDVSLDAESAARKCAAAKTLALPVVAAGRVIGVLTVNDALRILEDAESEDHAREGGSEPLHRPYLSTSVMRLVRSRVVWLLVLAISAVLTVRVLEFFEATIDQMVVLALFIPLLTGTGGNTGNQAATTVTRALALGDLQVRDMGRVLLREVRVGAMLGLLLGSLGFVVASAFYGPGIGQVIGLTLFGVCTIAATVGGAMPLIGKAIGVDPAVFSNPFISTFCDAAGLILYFLVAKLLLGL